MMNMFLVQSKAFKELLKQLHIAYISQETGYFLIELGNLLQHDFLNDERSAAEMQIGFATQLVSTIDGYRVNNNISDLLHQLNTRHFSKNIHLNPHTVLEQLTPYIKNKVNDVDVTMVENSIVSLHQRYLEHFCESRVDFISVTAIQILNDLLTYVPSNLDICRYGVSPRFDIILFHIEGKRSYIPT